MGNKKDTDLKAFLNDKGIMKVDLIIDTIELHMKRNGFKSIDENLTFKK